MYGSDTVSVASIICIVGAGGIFTMVVGCGGVMFVCV